MSSETPSVWFITGSQHLYGPETLAKVAEHSQSVVNALSDDSAIPVRLVFKPVAKTAAEISYLCADANVDSSCIGVVCWMHTFSPAKMWIAGLSALHKPLLHLHTQFNRDIPWDAIDMDFMNLNQSAHGDREFGFIGARMGIARKIVVGHWEDPTVRADIAAWQRVALAQAESRSLKVARFGDNMRDVAVTEGDKVEAQIQFGWTVSGYGVGDLVQRVKACAEAQVDELMSRYEDAYDFASNVKQAGPVRNAVRYQARLELALRSFLDEHGCTAFTTTFEDLHGLEQLPGLAAQRLMEAGYGFAGEGDWKTAALVRVMKVMASNKGTSFMEDYTYHLEPGNESILGSHMLEVCPTIAATRPRVEVHPLSIGGKADPARLVFNGGQGAAVCASIVDMGTRFRLIVSEVDAVNIEHDMPVLPVARVLWKPRPSLRTAAQAWILAGGAHHTGFSFEITSEQLSDWAEIAGIECVIIGKDTTAASMRDALRWNEAAWKLR
jgi:L-arabinose isomerase